jgi:hypothetical protein
MAISYPSLRPGVATGRGQKLAAAPGQFDFPKSWPVLWTRAVSTVQSIPEPWQMLFHLGVDSLSQLMF